jgi:hypothetical protein
MPNFKGMNLQAAQNKVQSDLGIFYSVSHDLRGSRNQIVDGNWEVCTQTPASSAKLSGPVSSHEGQIDFGVVKIGEGCP